MKNQNFKIIKKVNEERYFRNYSELFDFIVTRTMGYDIDGIYDFANRCNSVFYEVLAPMQKCGIIRVGKFICALTNGSFIRKSGDYQYNLLSLQKIDNLTHNDMKKLFNY